MNKIYEAPTLFVDEYVADTMIASSGIEDEEAKNGNPKNQNCYGCNENYMDVYLDDYCYIDPVYNPDFYEAACK